MPSPYEFAVMSEQVYNEPKKGQPPKGWIRMLNAGATMTTDHGYYGCAYYNPVTQELVIAHRGTANKENFASCKQIAQKQVPKAHKMAQHFKKAVDAEIQLKGWGVTKTYHTGHSLGGVHAQLAAAEENTEAYSFDSPGCVTLLRDHCHKHGLNSPQVKLYLTKPNIINYGWDNFKLEDLRSIIDFDWSKFGIYQWNERHHGEEVHCVDIRTTNSYNPQSLEEIAKLTQNAAFKEQGYLSDIIEFVFKQALAQKELHSISGFVAALHPSVIGQNIQQLSQDQWRQLAEPSQLEAFIARHKRYNKLVSRYHHVEEEIIRTKPNEYLAFKKKIESIIEAKIRRHTNPSDPQIRLQLAAAYAEIDDARVDKALDHFITLYTGDQLDAFWRAIHVAYNTSRYDKVIKYASRIEELVAGNQPVIEYLNPRISLFLLRAFVETQNYHLAQQQLIILEASSEFFNREEGLLNKLQYLLSISQNHEALPLLKQIQQMQLNRQQKQRLFNYSALLVQSALPQLQQLLDQNALDQARKLVDSLEGVRINNAEFLALQAQLAYRQKNHDIALVLLQQAKKAVSTNAQSQKINAISHEIVSPYLLVIHQAIRDQNIARANLLISKIKEFAKDNGEFWYYQARLYYINNSDRELVPMAEAIQKARDLHPDAETTLLDNIRDLREQILVRLFNTTISHSDKKIRLRAAIALSCFKMSDYRVNYGKALHFSDSGEHILAAEKTVEMMKNISDIHLDLGSLSLQQFCHRVLNNLLHYATSAGLQANSLRSVISLAQELAPNEAQQQQITVLKQRLAAMRPTTAARPATQMRQHTVFAPMPASQSHQGSSSHQAPAEHRQVQPQRAKR